MFNDFPNDCGRESQQDIEYKNKISPQDFLLFQQKRMSASLFKFFLVELEGLVEDGLISEEYYNKKRKIILDIAGNNYREFEEYISKLNIRFKK